MSEVTRRDALRRLALAFTAAGFIDRVDAREVHDLAAQATAAGGATRRRHSPALSSRRSSG